MQKQGGKSDMKQINRMQKQDGKSEPCLNCKEKQPSYSNKLKEKLLLEKIPMFSLSSLSSIKIKKKFVTQIVARDSFNENHNKSGKIHNLMKVVTTYEANIITSFCCLPEKHHNKNIKTSLDAQVFFSRYYIDESFVDKRFHLLRLFQFNKYSGLFAEILTLNNMIRKIYVGPYKPKAVESLNNHINIGIGKVFIKVRKELIDERTLYHLDFIRQFVLTKTYVQKGEIMKKNKPEEKIKKINEVQSLLCTELPLSPIKGLCSFY